eukprot:16328748-Heterocapsa_arctica.AAC.1
MCSRPPRRKRQPRALRQLGKGGTVTRKRSKMKGRATMKGPKRGMIPRRCSRKGGARWHRKASSDPWRSTPTRDSTIGLGQSWKQNLNNGRRRPRIRKQRRIQQGQQEAPEAAREGRPGKPTMSRGRTQ